MASSSAETSDPLTSCVICRKTESIGEIFDVNTEPQCLHKFCQSCTQEKFRRMGRKFKCPYPYCTADVSREKLRQIDPYEMEAESDNSIRRTYKAVFNKSREDFATLEDFWQYQEKFETIVYNLVHGINVEETKKEIEQYRQENRNYIATKEARRDADLDDELRRIDEERKQQEESTKQYQMKLLKEKQADEIKRKRANRMALTGVQETDEDAMEIESETEQQQEVSKPAEQKDNVLIIPETHPLINLLRKYPPPQMASKQPTKQQAKDTNTKLKMHLAGGYEYKSIYHARNLSEIKHQLEEVNPSIHV